MESVFRLIEPNNFEYLKLFLSYSKLIQSDSLFSVVLYDIKKLPKMLSQNIELFKFFDQWIFSLPKTNDRDRNFSKSTLNFCKL